MNASPCLSVFNNASLRLKMHREADMQSMLQNTGKRPKAKKNVPQVSIESKETLRKVSYRPKATLQLCLIMQGNVKKSTFPHT